MKLDLTKFIELTDRDNWPEGFSGGIDTALGNDRELHAHAKLAAEGIAELARELADGIKVAALLASRESGLSPLAEIETLVRAIRQAIEASGIARTATRSCWTDRSAGTEELRAETRRKRDALADELCRAEAAAELEDTRRSETIGRLVKAGLTRERAECAVPATPETERAARTAQLARMRLEIGRMDRFLRDFPLYRTELLESGDADLRLVESSE